MAVLVLAEHDAKTVRKATLNTVAAAQKIGGDIHVLVAGHNCAEAAKAAAAIAGEVVDVRRMLDRQEVHA